MANQKITDLTEDTAPDVAADYAVTVDASAGANKKVLLKNIMGGFKGALVKKSADETTANYTTAAAIPWDAETYDVGGWHSTVTNNSRFTVPAGVTKVRMQGGVDIAATTSGNFHLLQIQKNGSLAYDGCARQEIEIAASSSRMNLASPVLEVTAGDYFELFFFSEADASLTLNAANSWFAIESVV